jgi:nucleosome binding factor SPN SPT16 subunit
MYDPDEIEEEQREREKRNKINADFKQFTTRVQVRPGRILCSRGGMWPTFQGASFSRSATAAVARL